MNYFLATASLLLITLGFNSNAMKKRPQPNEQQLRQRTPLSKSLAKPLIMPTKAKSNPPTIFVMKTGKSENCNNNNTGAAINHCPTKFNPVNNIAQRQSTTQKNEEDSDACCEKAAGAAACGCCAALLIGLMKNNSSGD